MSVDDLVQTAERAAQVLIKMADEVHEAGLEAQAILLLHVSQALERVARDALAAPDETPSSGLDMLINELEHPAATVLTGAVAKRLAEKLRLGRSIVRALLAPAEIAGDADLIERAQAWLRDTGNLRKMEG